MWETGVTVGSILSKNGRPRKTDSASLGVLSPAIGSSPESAIGSYWPCPLICFDASQGTCQRALRLKSSKLVWNASCGAHVGRPGGLRPAQQTMCSGYPQPLPSQVKVKLAQPLRTHLRFSAGMSVFFFFNGLFWKQASPRMRFRARPWLSALCYIGPSLPQGHTRTCLALPLRP